MVSQSGEWKKIQEKQQYQPIEKQQYQPIDAMRQKNGGSGE
jgi:hypothetical protein